MRFWAHSRLTRTITKQKIIIEYVLIRLWIFNKLAFVVLVFLEIASFNHVYISIHNIKHTEKKKIWRRNIFFNFSIIIVEVLKLGIQIKSKCWKIKRKGMCNLTQSSSFIWVACKFMRQLFKLLQIETTEKKLERKQFNLN